MGFIVNPNPAPERGERNAMTVPINIDAGKSGGGPPQSKTLRAARKPWNDAKRLGVRQSSGALLCEPRSKINPNGIIRSLFRRVSDALAALVLFLAVVATAETANDSVGAIIQGRKLASQILEQHPTEGFTKSGMLKIRNSSKDSLDIPLKCDVLLSSNSWQNIFTAFFTNHTEILTITVSPDIQIYRLGGDFPDQGFMTGSNPNRLGPLTTYHHTGMANRPTNVLNKGKTDYSMIPFANSDFWRCDLGLEFFHWPAQKVLPKTTNLKRGREYTLLESTNPNPATNGYSRVLTWIDKESGGILEAEAYDMNGKLLKDFAPKSFKKVNGQWELQEMEIRNVQTGSRTRLEFDLKK
ncbi:MAG TPA: outer membrane lipoprotein-sorting protein [Verrucomicrobiae bacterium]